MLSKLFRMDLNVIKSESLVISFGNVLSLFARDFLFFVSNETEQLSQGEIIPLKINQKIILFVLALTDSNIYFP